MAKVTATGWRTQLSIAFALMSVLPLLTLGYFISAYIMPKIVTRENLLLTIILNLVLSVSGFWIILNMIHSIRKVAMSINSVAGGDLDVKVENPQNPELHDMAESLSSIIDALQNDRVRLQEFNTELEKRVRKKTNELSEANTYLKKELYERKKAELSLMNSQEELRALACKLESTRETERRRIEREIHDELGQSLTALKFDIVWLRANVKDNNSATLDRISEMAQVVDGTVKTVRRICSQLRPIILDQFGLKEAIQRQIDQFVNRTGCECNFVIDEKNETGEDQSLVLFRCLQEALNNITKHAEASEVTVNLSACDGNASLEITDNGKGISDKDMNKGKDSLGLIGLRERARSLGGRFEVSGVKGKGTCVKMILPFN